MSNIAYLFPGQGSQSVGMLADLRELGNDIEEHLVRASEVIDVDLMEIVACGPEEKLNQTEITQPAILATSIGLFSMTRRLGLEMPYAAAGHSLGEYSASVASGMLDFESAVQLVHERGRIMQAAIPEGSGAIVVVLGLDDETVQQVCDSVDETVEIANFNCPEQVVIAGLTSAVERVSVACMDAGAWRVVPIPMSVPSHCSLLHSARKHLEEVLSPLEFQHSNFTVYQNINAKVTDDPEEFKQNLVGQINSSVLWHQSIRAMIDHGINTFVECGPGRVLTGLMRRIDREVTAKALSNRETLEELIRG